jgi:nucleotide-binding universal stress UspA family protein
MSTPTSPRTIVVGTSGAVEDGPALGWAIDEAKRTRARLTIAHACSHPAGGEGDAQLAGHPGLANVIAWARLALGDDHVRVTVGTCPAGRMLVDLVDPSSLLVIGPPSRGGWTHWGSATQYAARHAPCPVVIARRVAEPGRGAPFAGHVVVGVDGSPASQAALAFAFGVADRHQLPLAAVYVTGWSAGDVWYDDQLRETHLTTEPEALQLLAREVEPWERAYPRVWVKRAVFCAYRTVDGLLRAADGASLLAVGADDGLRHQLLLSSISLDAMSQATGPVVLVPAHGTVADQPAAGEAVHSGQAGITVR